jgi:hypothetical protein
MDTPNPRRFARWIVGGLLIRAIGYVAADRFLTSKYAMPAAVEATAFSTHVEALSDKSIAVLPFADMSEKKDQEYFADVRLEVHLGLRQQFR